VFESFAHFTIGMGHWVWVWLWVCSRGIFHCSMMQQTQSRPLPRPVPFRTHGNGGAG